MATAVTKVLKIMKTKAKAKTSRTVMITAAVTATKAVIPNERHHHFNFRILKEFWILCSSSGKNNHACRTIQRISRTFIPIGLSSHSTPQWIMYNTHNRKDCTENTNLLNITLLEVKTIHPNKQRTNFRGSAIVKYLYSSATLCNSLLRPSHRF